MNEESEDEILPPSIMEVGEESQAVDLERQRQLQQAKDREDERRRIDSKNMKYLRRLQRK